MKKKVRLLVSVFCLMIAACMGALTAAAAEDEEHAPGWDRRGAYYTYYDADGELTTGWKKINGKVYYLRPEAEGKAPAGSRVTGFYKVGKNTFYFSGKGVMQLGWKTIKNKNYYFAKTGKAGKYGAMYTGFKKIGKDYFYFNKDGSVHVGWKTYNNKKYFFSNSKKLGIRGRALTGWKTIGSGRYYFDAKGVMQKNRWINKKYYLGADGKMLKSCVTPDGRVVDSKGVKKRIANGWIKQGGKYYYYVSGKKTTGWKTIKGKRYYFDEDGVRQNGLITVDGHKYYLKSCVMQTGWKTIKGKQYYFKKDGKMAVSTVIDGKVIGADGAATGETVEPDKGEEDSQDALDGQGNGAKILIVAGHGQGDSGAVGYYSKKTYYESTCTREFANLIKQKLAGSNLKVTMYDQDYDLYQVLSGKKSGPKPNLKNYDYVLEIHFNATIPANKDSGGDGVHKGVGMYVNSGKKNTTIDKNIVKAISGTGFRIWGGGTGIFKSSGLFNAKTCQGKGVSYGLLETAFIDDKDDMNFYEKHKEQMAQAVATALVSYFK